MLRNAIAIFWLVLPAIPAAAQMPRAARATERPFLPANFEELGWPHVRGPNFDGHSSEINIADEWPETGPPVLWVRELGQGYSAFVAMGHRVYTQGQTLTGQYLYCLDSRSGDTLWKYRYDWPYQGMSVYPGPRSTPTFREGRVYFSAPNGLIGCLNAETGKLVWSKNVIEEYNGRGGTGFGYACSPTVIDGLVILPVGGESASMVALDADDGAEVWSSGSDPSSYASALPIDRNGRRLIVGYLENSLVIHDRQTGELLASERLSEGYDEHSVWPIYQEPYLWLSGPFRSGSRLLELSDQFDSTQELSVVWDRTILSNDVVSSVLVDGHLYGFDIFDVQAKTQRPSRGKFRCIEFITGEEQWEQGTGRPRRGSGNDDDSEIGQAGIIVADGKLILLNERGELILLRATPDECDILARTTILGGELTWSPPILHRGCVYARNHSRAVCIYVGEPEYLDQSQPVLSVADIPQAKYVDWTATILAIEPEYAFDVPSPRLLLSWYMASLAILLSSGIIAVAIARFVPVTYRIDVQKRSYEALAFAGGLAGTTVLSTPLDQFIFTWPVCLFVAFEPVVSSVRNKKDSPRSRPAAWADRIAFIGFLAVCLAYFLICRRLSLVFEWSFLLGFLGAIPFYRLKNRFHSAGIGSVSIRLLLTALAFSGFYACGIVPLLLKQ